MRRASLSFFRVPYHSIVYLAYVICVPPNLHFSLFDMFHARTYISTKKKKHVYLYRYGVPVVCTVVSTEGMFPENRKNILAVEEGDASAFASAVVELYTNPKLWQTVKENHMLIICLLFRSPPPLMCVFYGNNNYKFLLLSNR
jgi:hypothetical protein